MRAKPCIGFESILEKGARKPLFVFRSFLHWNKSLFEKIRNGQNPTHSFTVDVETNCPSKSSQQFVCSVMVNFTRGIDFKSDSCCTIVTSTSKDLLTPDGLATEMSGYLRTVWSSNGSPVVVMKPFPLIRLVSVETAVLRRYFFCRPDAVDETLSTFCRISAPCISAGVFARFGQDAILSDSFLT